MNYKKTDVAIDNMKDSLIASIQESIRIKGYNNNSLQTPSDGVKAALDHAMWTASAMGLRTYKHPEYRYGWAELGDKSLNEMVMVLGHLDTVPEGELSDWTEGGPFEGKIADGKIIGRGAIDDKGPTIAALYALKAIMDCGARLGRRIRVFFGTSEDGYGDDGKKWSCVAEYAARCEKGEEEWPIFGFSPDADNFAVTYIEKTWVNTVGAIKLPPANEGSPTLERLGGGTALNAVSDFCSGTIACSQSIFLSLEKIISSLEWKNDVKLEFKDGKINFEVKGVAAHSGQAWKGKNANVRALWILSKVEGANFQNVAQKLVELVGVDTADGEGLGIKQGSREIDDIITTNMGLLGYDKEAGKITFHINTRYPDSGADLLAPDIKHYTGQEIKQKIIAAFVAKGFDVGEEGSGAEVCVSGGAKPYTIPWDSEIVSKLRNAYKMATGVDKKPEIGYGGTYASAWEKQIGYRMAAWGLEGGGLIHAPNEYVEIDALIKGTKIMARAMGDLANAE